MKPLQPSGLTSLVFVATFLSIIFSVADSQNTVPAVPAMRVALTIPGRSLRQAQKEFRTSGKSSGAWVSFPPLESRPVTDCSIAGNASRLYVFYEEPRPDLNFNLGVTKQWGGNNWLPFSQTNDCNGPSIVLKDTIIVEGCETASYQYQFGTNEKGGWVGQTNASLFHQYGTRVAIAEGKGYVSYADASHGYMGVAVSCPFNYGCLMSGQHGTSSGSVGTSPQFAGDDSGWVTLFASGGWLYAHGAGPGCRNPAYNDIGFRSLQCSGAVQPAWIGTRAGFLTAIWTEGSKDSLYVAEWNGSQWTLVINGPTTGAYFGISAVTVDSVLYMSFGDTGSDPRLSVIRWDGVNFDYMDGAIEDRSTSTIPSVALTTYNGAPTIAFVEDDTLKVKSYSIRTEVVEKPRAPVDCALYQNYPNPFNPTTVISGQLTADSKIRLTVYDLLGREVAVLADGSYPAGGFSVTFDARDLSSGVYFYRLTAGDYTSVRTMILVR